ncbi:baseplate protein [Citrobacter werkmanii]|uniref:baseplate protein n=1 Tax=Citrobacter werkmanii TaxID=67827 RepID=UPI0037CBADDE
MTAQDLLNLFTSLISKNPWWSRFANSQFMKMMAVFGAQIIYYARMYAETALPEGFISTANKRSSILAAAEDRGYVARLIVPSSGKVTINNKTGIAQQLPAYMTIWGENQYPYVLMDTVNLAPQGVANNVSISQMEKVTITVKVDVGQEFFTVLLPKDITAKTVSLAVYVTNGGKKEKWEENPQFRLANSRSKNYVTFYKPTEQLGVRFGDGSIGMMIPDNSQIDIEVWTSEGDITLVSGQRLTPSGAFQSRATDLEIITSTPITNGAEMESTEETRNRAMYHVAYDDQIVWRGDYKFYLKGKIPGITWLNVWGEAEEEKANGAEALANGHNDGDIITLPSGDTALLKNGLLYDLNNTNTIFISAHKPGVAQTAAKKANPGDPDMETMILDTLAAIPNRLNKTFKYYESNELPFSVIVTGIAYTETIISDAQASIKSVLEEKFGKDAVTPESTRIGDYETVKVNEIWAAIQALKLLSKFEVQIVGMKPATKLFDFVYLDANASKIDIKYYGG